MNRRSGEFAPWRALLLFPLCACLSVGAPSPAAAQFHVTQPDVVEGKGTVADHAAIYAGPGTDEKLDQGHELELFYGLADRLAMVTVGLLQQPIGGQLEGQQYEAGAQYEFLKPQGEGIALAFRSLYQLSLQDGTPDKVLFGPIGKIASENASATIDSFFVRDLGGADTTALELKWQLKHTVTERISVGVEGYSQIKDIADPGSFNDQEHRVGPVVYFKFGP
jgi:hypothetical protein